MPKTQHDLFNAVLEMLGGPFHGEQLVKSTNLGFALGVFEGKPGKHEEVISDAEFERMRAKFERQVPAFREFLLNAPTDPAAFRNYIAKHGPPAWRALAS